MFRYLILIIASAYLALLVPIHSTKTVVAALFVIWMTFKYVYASGLLNHTGLIEVCAKVRRLLVIAALCTGFHHFNLDRIFDSQLPSELEGKTLELVGRVNQMPERDGEFLRFELDVKELRLPSVEDTLAFKGLVRLSWKTKHELQSGELWHFAVRLKRPRGFANPKGFDYQAWLLAKGVMATGYVYRGNAEKIQSASKANLAAIRQQIRDSLNTGLVNVPRAELIKALLIGDRSGISPEMWNRFRDTGTIHLMAISGLHVGLIAGFMGLLANVILRPLAIVFGPKVLRFSVALCSIGAAAFYAHMAGFSVPTQRALACVILVNVLLFFERRSAFLPLLLLIAAIAVSTNPFMLLQSGFVLSFAAVGALLYAFLNERRPVSGKGKQWVNMLAQFVFAQLVLLVGLFPIMTWLNLPSALLAPMANFIAVPTVSFIVLPTSFIALAISAVSESAAIFLFAVAGESLQLLDTYLWFVENQTIYLELQKNLNGFDLTLLLISVLFLFAPSALRIRSAGIYTLGLVLLQLYMPTSKKQNEIVILDAGQGLASMIKGRDATLVYDIGARFSDSFSIAQQVLLPYLSMHTHAPVSAVVLSHADNDHAGDAPALLKELINNQRKVPKVYTGEPDELAGLSPERCSVGADLQHLSVSSDIQLMFLWPDPKLHIPSKMQAKLDKSNNLSCVLLLRVAGKTILFPGDIEKEVEAILLSNGILPKGVDVLIAPHHGSATSSTAAFVQYLQPKHVIFTAGFRNRYKHPAKRVVECYQRVGSKLWNTAEHGAISITVEEGLLKIRSERCENRRRWYDTSAQICESGSSQ